jgi:hypothetical protein
MWFARLFGGGRGEEQENDEPARFAAPQAIKPEAPEEPSSTAGVRVPRANPKIKAKGFDPYNSGGFERRNAWERTNLR